MSSLGSVGGLINNYIEDDDEGNMWSNYYIEDVVEANMWNNIGDNDTY
jgi:hypothetical protein